MVVAGSHCVEVASSDRATEQAQRGVKRSGAEVQAVEQGGERPRIREHGKQRIARLVQRQVFADDAPRHRQQLAGRQPL